MTTISIVCPTYNSASFIERTLKSIAEQTQTAFELIISDDGSTDNTLQTVENFLKKYPALSYKILKNPHRGPGATRNAGIKVAEGHWIAFIDSDDEWHPDKLATITEAIKDNPAVNLFCNSKQHVRLDGSTQVFDFGSWVNPAKPFVHQLYLKNFFTPSAVTCQKELLIKANLFDEKLMSAQDYELWLKMSPWIKPYFVRKVLGFYYDRDGNITSSSAWKRFKNNMIILVRHRRKVPITLFIYRVLRIAISLLIVNPIRLKLKK